MPKIIKSTISCVLAFFILGGFLITSSLNAQDTITLQNGLRVVIKEDHKSPIIVFSAFIDVGSAQEDEYLGSGICHLIEHMLFKGTDKYPKGRIEAILHMYGGKIDGFTSYDYTGYRITILKEHARVALDILKEMLSAPIFDSRELKKEMQVIEREIDLSRDNPGKRLSMLTFSSAYLKHPYRVPIIGYKENFRRLKQEDLVKFFKSNYTPEKIIIAVVGDVEKDKASAQIQELFKDMPRGNNEILVLPSEPEQLGKKEIEEKADIDGAYLNMAFHSTS
ncbi:MAG: insulinase family protein, partial [Candidatus Omnitrophica bacterium]|nr:insulinase family protein [Candidatus Omnitrophota bacterium]